MLYEFNYPSDIATYVPADVYDEFTRVWPMLLRIGIITAVVIVLLFLLFYVFFSLAVYTMSVRRGLPASFAAWIPFVRWGVAGRVASDSHEVRTGRKAFYGTFLLLLMLLPALVGIALTFSDLPGWVMGLAGLMTAALGLLKLFALSEIYRDYSKHWVGLLIFTTLCDVLVPIFLIAIHKNIPLSTQRAARSRRPDAPAPAAPEKPEAPAPVATPPAAPEKPAPEAVETEAAETIITPPPVLDAEAVEEVEALLKDTADTVSGE